MRNLLVFSFLVVFSLVSAQIEEKYLPKVDTITFANRELYYTFLESADNTKVVEDENEIKVFYLNIDYYKVFTTLKNSPYKLLTSFDGFEGKRYAGHHYYFYTFEVGDKVTNLAEDHKSKKKLHTESLESKYKITHKDLIALLQKEYYIDLIADYRDKEIESYRIDKEEDPLYKAPFYVVIYNMDPYKYSNKYHSIALGLIMKNNSEFQTLSYNFLAQPKKLGRYLIINAETGDTEMDVKAYKGYFNYLEAYKSLLKENRIEINVPLN